MHSLYAAECDMREICCPTEKAREEAVSTQDESMFFNIEHMQKNVSIFSRVASSEDGGSHAENHACVDACQSDQ